MVGANPLEDADVSVTVHNSTRTRIYLTYGHEVLVIDPILRAKMNRHNILSHLSEN